MASMAPWILYKLLVQDGMHKQMHAANSFDVASAMTLIRAIADARHAELHPRAVCLGSAAIRPRALNKFEAAVQQMRAGAAAAPATNNEVQRLFGRVDKSTRRKRQRT